MYLCVAYAYVLDMFNSENINKVISYNAVFNSLCILLKKLKYNMKSMKYITKICLPSSTMNTFHHFVTFVLAIDLYIFLKVRA